MKIDLVFCPSALESYPHLQNSLAIVIDVLRASSTMCALVESDAAKVTVCGSIEDALAQRDVCQDLTKCCVGERGGIAPEGFLCGNSPLEIRETTQLKNQHVFYATTNGTRMLHASNGAVQQLVGSFGNMHLLDVAIDNACGQFPAINTLLLCCSGNDEGFSLEDSFFAGAFITRYIANGESHNLTDAAQAAVCIANAYNLDPELVGINARHARLLRAMGYGSDVEFCLRERQFRTVPHCVQMDLREFS